MNIKTIDKLDGGIAGVLMGFDGIAVDSYAKAGFGDSLPDIQTLAAEFAHLVSQARRTVQSLDAGALSEVTYSHGQDDPGGAPSSRPDYFLACAILPTGNRGPGALSRHAPFGPRAARRALGGSPRPP